MAITLTWLGHSTVVLDMDGVRLVADPLLRRHNGVLRRRGDRPDGVAWSGADAVLLSHLHHDHAEVASLRMLRGVPVLTAPENAAWVTRKGLDGRGLLDGEWMTVGDEDEDEDEVAVRLVEAVHHSRPMPHRPNAAHGHLVRGPSGVVWIAGDTDLYPDMALLGDWAGAPVDVAVVPVGGWGPRLSPGHMGPGEAAEACRRSGARWALPVHWKTLHVPTGEMFPRGWMDSAGPRFTEHLARVAPSCEALEVEAGGSWTAPGADDGARPRPSHTLRGIRGAARTARLDPRTTPTGQGRDMERVDPVAADDGAPGDWLAGQVARYRDTRSRIERGTLPIATSVDGRTFELQASLHGLRLKCGAYVTLETDAGTRLGQITELAQHSVSTEVEDETGSRATILLRLAVGRGLLLDGGAPFHDARVAVAEAEVVADWLEGTRPARSMLVVGELSEAPGVPAEFDSAGLGRHTFMCGQSGSGKTYSLGLLLERVLAETTLRVVVLDPNSDHVGLGKVRPDADPEAAGRYRRVTGEVAVWGAEEADHALHLRFDELDHRAQAAVLGIDPVRDLEEYDALVDLLARRADGRPLVAGLPDLLDSPRPAVRRLGMRARNLGVLDWAVWSPTERSLLEEIARPTSRCVVVDLGSLATTGEQRVVSDAVLAALWAHRHAREPVLLVIDEAHNICASAPEDPVATISTERAVQIAAEGRKYGLYLLVSTQRPGKVHENVVSQCDNLVLMRMNGAADVVELQRIFSFVPPGLITGATTFTMGQGLVSGRIFPPGSGYVQMGARVSQEGGADVPLTWARPPVP